MNQRVSLSCVLSELSPVAIASCSWRLLIGLVVLRSWPTIALEHLRREALLRPVRRRERRAEAVEELDPQRRLLVDDVRVGELAEVEELGACLAARGKRLAEVVADDIALTGPGFEPVVAVGIDDRLLDGRARTRHGPGGRKDGNQAEDGGNGDKSSVVHIL